MSVSVLAQDVSILDSSATATTSSTIITGIPYLRAVMVNQDPSTADPGAYVNVLFKIENIGTNGALNTTLTLIPEYPLSLDPGVSPTVSLGTISGLQTGNNAYLVRYKLKVDENAVNGENEIKLKYSMGDGSVYNLAKFNITVSNPRTDFDVVAQDASTIAIANVGANSASSVIVRIPDQQNFRTNGTSASIIGNLNAGDYTLASFQILSSRTPNSTNVSPAASNLTVEISYTDTLGIRRTVEKSVPFGFSNIASTGRTLQRSQTSVVSNGLEYIIIGVVGIVVVVALIKIRSRKRK
ncbi:MAG: hypothetical protein V1850_06905 [Candidatus Bathyarchaeota archaeon]